MSWSMDEVARRIADAIPHGSIANLGVGLPLGVGDHLSDPSVVLHSENGILGMGPKPPPGEEDPDIVNAGKQNVTLVPGAAITDQVTSFALVRSGRLSLAVLGAFQVSAAGDVANWKRPGEKIAGVGGAVDIANGARSVWVMMRAVTDGGTSKLVRECTFPLTASGVVDRVYTDLGVLIPDAQHGRFRVMELADGVTRDELEAAVAADVEWDPQLSGAEA